MIDTNERGSEMTLIERLVSGEPYDSLVKEAVADRLEQAEKVIDELEKAVEAVEINAEECLDFDDSLAMLVPIGDYHKLIEALASAKAWKEGT